MKRLLPKIRIKKLNTSGVGHHALIAVLVVTTIAGVGAWRVWSSSAAVSNSPVLSASEQRGCILVGRKWSNNTCLDVNSLKSADRNNQAKLDTLCSANAGSFKKAGSVQVEGSPNATSFCTNFIANTASQTGCKNLGRVWISGAGCVQAVADQANSPRCFDAAKPNYNFRPDDGKADRCEGTAPTTSTPTPTSSTPAPTEGGTSTDATYPKKFGNAPGTFDDINDPNCSALGRVFVAGKGCERVCQPNGGVLWQREQKGRLYCPAAVATGISETDCKLLNRRWVGMGCARRIDQKDNANDTIRCVAGYPYYNANTTASSSGNLDVCEKNEAEAKTNEEQKLTPDVQNNPINAPIEEPNLEDNPDGSAANGTDSTAELNENGQLTVEGEYRITFFKNNDFKGDKLVVVARIIDGKMTMVMAVNGKKLNPMPANLASMPNGWNDKISSYVISSGRWKLCPDANYRATTKLRCLNPYASNPNINETSDSKSRLGDQISSVIPVVVNTTREQKPPVDAEGNPIPTQDWQPVLPQCLDEDARPVAVTGDGSCPDNSTLGCPAGFKLENENESECLEKVVAPNVVVPVDASIKKGECALLGREWISVANDGQHGCSTFTCEKPRDGAPRGSGNQKVATCVDYIHGYPYAVPMEKKTCENLHRIYIDQVGRCAQVTNRKSDKAVQKEVRVDQCRGQSYTVYYIYNKDRKDDECFTASVFDRAKQVASSTKAGIGSVLKIGPKLFCERKSGFKWENGRCKEHRQDRSGVVDCSATPKAEACLDGGSRTLLASDCYYANGKWEDTPACRDLCNFADRTWKNGTCSKECKSITQYLMESNPVDLCQSFGTGIPGFGDSSGGYNVTEGSGNNLNCYRGQCIDGYIKVFFGGSSLTYGDITASKNFSKPTTILVTKGEWKLCADVSGQRDNCVPLSPGSNDMCAVTIQSTNFSESKGRACDKSNLYVHRR